MVDQSRHYKYESPALTHLIKKLDRLVETLAFCEAACSGLHNHEDAEKRLKKLNEGVKQVLYQIKRSKNVIHVSCLKQNSPCIKRAREF